jgi:aminodeoxyfutalosine synthase
VAGSAGDVGRRRPEGRGNLEEDRSLNIMAVLTEFEDKVRSGQPLSRDEGRRVLSERDLIGIGMLAEAARKARHGDRITFVRVCEIGDGAPPADRGEAGEVRLVSRPASADDAVARVRDAAAFAAGVPLTGFSAVDLLSLCGSDHVALAELATALKRAGLDAVAEVPLDEFAATEDATETVRAIVRAGLGAWRATVSRPVAGDPLEVIVRAADVQREALSFRAFAPLPRHDSRSEPSTGYDDVRTIAVARLVCRDIPSIQVDWRLYGPKLAQVAIAYGADDLDSVAWTDSPGAGPRRSAREDIGRQIRMAFAVPVERDGRYETRS